MHFNQVYERFLVSVVLSLRTVLFISYFLQDNYAKKNLRCKYEIAFHLLPSHTKFLFLEATHILFTFIIDYTNWFINPLNVIHTLRMQFAFP